MPNDRRPTSAGGTYSITQVTYKRQPWLCSDIARCALRIAINWVRQNRPFVIDAFVQGIYAPHWGNPIIHSDPGASRYES